MDAILVAAAMLLVVWTVAPALAGEAAPPADGRDWTIYITNDNCPDYTWGLTEGETRQAFADIVKGHLDEMKRTDGQAPENQDRYNMAVTQEALCFVEKYPDRKDELVRRINEGRVFVSPYLCNTLWAFQSTEGTIRALGPARRLERAWGIPKIEWAEHIEEPSLPWGTATILAGCGIRWLSNPFYNYDSTFSQLKTPPVFIYEGPDGSALRVVMDPWASNKASYTQGANLLGNTGAIRKDWIPHYLALGEKYAARANLASGTHGDINPGSGGQARGFAEKIIQANAQPGDHPKLVNAILPQFCQAVDEAEARKAYLPVVRGDFGHSWDLWPVCLAKYAADMREGERQFLAAEALLAVAMQKTPAIAESTRADRERAEWCWAMLADHAWNGTDEKNKRHNADLRKKWSEELGRIARDLQAKAWAAAGLEASAKHVTVFNPLSVPRADLVRMEAVEGVGAARVADGPYLDVQTVSEDGREIMYFVSPPVSGFGCESVELTPPLPKIPPPPKYRASPTSLESDVFRLTVGPKTGGISSLVDKSTGRELVAAGGRTLCQTLYFSGKEHTLADVKSEVAAEGPVLSRLKITGTVEAIRVTAFVTLYAGLPRVDFDIRIEKPVTTREERLCHVFPVVQDGDVLRIETPGAVIRPRPQPEGDLLPGADTRRFAVQGFVDASAADGPGVTIVPLDAFCLRTDLGQVTFEALGNDQNYREVVQDQHGVTQFRFRYSLWKHGKYDEADVVARSRAAATPLQAVLGRLVDEKVQSPIKIDPARAVATCLKPADDPAAGGLILRLWETAGKSGPITLGLPGIGKVVRTDLLERDQGEIKIEKGKVTLDLPARGMAAIRLVP